MFKTYLLTITTIHSWSYFIRKVLLWFSSWMIFIIFTQSDNLKLSKATHMASVLLDIHLEIPAVKKPNAQCVHSVLKITFRGQETVCRGGIVKRYIQELFTESLKSHHHSFLTSLPQQCQQLKAKDIQKQIKQFRCLLEFPFSLFPQLSSLTGFHSCGG